jgi:hypothetical protein
MKMLVLGCTLAGAIFLTPTCGGRVKHNPSCYEHGAKKESEDGIYFPCDDDEASPAPTTLAAPVDGYKNGCRVTGEQYVEEDGTIIFFPTSVICD